MQFYSCAFEVIPTRSDVLGKMTLPLIGLKFNFDGNRLYQDVRVVLVSFYQNFASLKLA
jgi:hypothetical protein